jgi:hypothetical protein
VKLTSLDPRWLYDGGRRVGFVFRNPIKGPRGWWVSCFSQPMPEETQERLIEAELGENALYQACNPASGWTIEGDDFADLTVTPSLDGGPGWWHGFITGGEIVGGLTP